MISPIKQTNQNQNPLRIEGGDTILVKINNVVNNLFTPRKSTNKQITFVPWSYIYLKI